MQWFKHDTNARNDIKIKLLKQKHGAEGYGVYFQLVEIIGENCKSENISQWGFVEAAHTVETLAIECGVSPDILRTVLKTCDEVGLFSQKKGKLYCKSIKKRLDDYARKTAKSREKVSGQETDKVRNRIEKNRKEKNRTDKTLFSADADENISFEDKRRIALEKAGRVK